MEWTKDKPTVAGYYWIRPAEKDWIDGFSSCQIVRVWKMTGNEPYPDGMIFRDTWVAEGARWNGCQALQHLNHWFSGPLLAPEFAIKPAPAEGIAG